MANIGKKFRCTLCESDFKAPNWVSADGSHRHTVEPKTYYAHAAHLVTYVSEERVVTLSDGRNRVIPARPVQFDKGSYTTRDPEDQVALDEQASGFITREQWENIHIGKEELLKIREKRAEMAIEKANAQNALLEQLKAENAKLKEDAEKK